MASTAEINREQLLLRNTREYEALYEAIKEKISQKARGKMIEHINNIEKDMEQSFALEQEKLDKARGLTPCFI